MEKRYINKDKILATINREEKLQVEKRKEIWYSRELTESKKEKLTEWIGKSIAKVEELKKRIKQ